MIRLKQRPSPGKKTEVGGDEDETEDDGEDGGTISGSGCEK